MTSEASPSFITALEAFLQQRLAQPTEGSYSHRLMTDSVLVQRKIMEEAFEVCLELAKEPADAALLAEESADLIFHLLSALVGAGVAWSDVETVLAGRHEGARS